MSETLEAGVATDSRHFERDPQVDIPGANLRFLNNSSHNTRICLLVRRASRDLRAHKSHQLASQQLLGRRQHRADVGHHSEQHPTQAVRHLCHVDTQLAQGHSSRSLERADYQQYGGATERAPAHE